MKMELCDPTYMRPLEQPNSQTGSRRVVARARDGDGGCGPMGRGLDLHDEKSAGDGWQHGAGALYTPELHT